MSVQVHSGFLGSTIEEKTRSLLGWTDHSRPSIVPPPVMASAVAFFETSPVQTDSRNGKKESGKRKKSIAPYHHLQRLPAAARVRKSSTSSSGSDSAVIRQLTPPPSPSGSCRSFCPTSTRRSSFDGYGPLPISPVSPNTPCPSNWKPSTRESEVFDRLRQLVPVLPSDKNAYQVLIETVSSVIDLEHQLEQLSEKTEDVRNKVLRRSSDPLVGAGIHCLDFSIDPFPDDLLGVDVTAFKSLLYTPSPEPCDPSRFESSPCSSSSSSSSSLASPSLNPLTIDTSFAIR